MTLLLIALGIIIALQITNIVIQIRHKRQNRREWAAFARLLDDYTSTVETLRDDQIMTFIEAQKNASFGARLGKDGMVVTVK